MKRELDIVIISDVHLGTYGCHARELLNYLNHIKPEILILNGDFIDVWQFRKQYFPREHLMIIQRILRMAAKGTKVYYVTGNHDDILRSYTDFSSGNIHLRDKLVLQLNDKKYWIFHGGIFDMSIKYSSYIAKLGGKGYDLLIRLNRLVNRLRKVMGRSPMSFARKVKYRVKEAVKSIGDFENTAIELAAEEGYDYVICGHIHRAQMRSLNVGEKRVTYLNSGDWVESLTALEYNWGHWSVYEYDEVDYALVNPKLSVEKKDKKREDEWGNEQIIWPEQNFDEILKNKSQNRAFVK